MKAKQQEENFQEVTNKYAANSIASMREELADEEQRERICSEGALEVSVREGWHSPGSEKEKPVEYYILLGTGGPASRIIGELSEYGTPETARFEYQDWFKQWTEAHLSKADQETLLEYANQFWFGE